ncbi:hypothetical protein CPB83DRAFT_849911 [Crepidotus variabilis]|uniref:Uncharacterized protein n=1 Tax=Crepidotus variabilis TaxID=179855 RepID=A0A9P6EKS4_9AGAR|nr:hypothetical protein CPB83DRAFT_849911 [Crepidotus variabilis]
MPAQTRLLQKHKRSFAPINHYKDLETYEEHLGIGPPTLDFGVSGDIYLDLTPSSLTLYARYSDEWKAWPGYQSNSESVAHPRHSTWSLWCDGISFGWFRASSIFRPAHSTTPSKLLSIAWQRQLDPPLRKERQKSVKELEVTKASAAVFRSVSMKQKVAKMRSLAGDAPLSLPDAEEIKLVGPEQFLFSNVDRLKTGSTTPSVDSQIATSTDSGEKQTSVKLETLEAIPKKQTPSCSTQDTSNKRKHPDNTPSVVLPQAAHPICIYDPDVVGSEGKRRKKIRRPKKKQEFEESQTAHNPLSKLPKIRSPSSREPVEVNTGDLTLMPTSGVIQPILQPPNRSISQLCKEIRDLLTPAIEPLLLQHVAIRLEQIVYLAEQKLVASRAASRPGENSNERQSNSPRVQVQDTVITPFSGTHLSVASTESSTLLEPRAVALAASRPQAVTSLVSSGPESCVYLSQDEEMQVDDPLPALNEPLDLALQSTSGVSPESPIYQGQSSQEELIHQKVDNQRTASVINCIGTSSVAPGLESTSLAHTQGTLAIPPVFTNGHDARKTAGYLLAENRASSLEHREVLNCYTEIPDNKKDRKGHKPFSSWLGEAQIPVLFGKLANETMMCRLCVAEQVTHRYNARQDSDPEALQEHLEQQHPRECGILRFLPDGVAQNLFQTP